MALRGCKFARPPAAKMMLILKNADLYDSDIRHPDAPAEHATKLDMRMSVVAHTAAARAALCARSVGFLAELARVPISVKYRLC